MLGAVLLEGRDMLARVAPALSSSDFFKDHHRIIFRRLLAMDEAGVTPSAMTLADALMEAGEYDEVGGAVTIAHLCETLVAAIPARLEDYVRIIRREAAKADQERELLAALVTIRNGGDPAALALAVSESLTRIAERIDPVKTGPTGPQHVGVILQAVVDSMDTPVTDVVPFPIAEVNERLGGGAMPGEVITIGGRPGTAKSALAIQTATHAAEHGYPTLVISREMKNAALGRRLLSQKAWVAALALRKRDLSDDEKRRIARALPRLGALPLWFDDTSSTIGQIRRLVRAGGYRFVIVDYLQLVRAPGIDDMRLQVTAVSHGLKDLAMRTGCSVMALSALSRLAMDKGKRVRPALDNLKESGDIEADADVVLILHQPKEDSSDRELIFAKVREGQSGGSVKLAFQAQYVSFTELPAEPGSEDVPF